MIRDLLRQEWDYHRERPFGRLVQLFVERIFRGGGDTDAEGLDLGVGLTLTLLAIPGGFVSVFLFDKYGSLLQWLRGQTNVDALVIAFPDEYFFIVLSMTVTGAIAVWRWDAIFPDRRDYMNLVHLPVATRTIFLANLLAVVFLAGLVAIDVNAASCVLFPMVVSASQGTLLFFLTFAAVHALGVLLSSLFSFLAVFAILGLLMAVLPPRLFRRVSAYARGMIVVYLVTLLCTSFAVPDLLRQVKGPPPSWTLLFPSCWFVSLCQLLRQRANPAMAELATLCVPAIAAIGVLALCTYAIGYRRHFVRISEIAEGTSVEHTPIPWRWTGVEQFLLRTPFQRGCFRFVAKTLLRSEAHRLVLTGVAGLALVLSSQALMHAFEGVKSAREAALTAEALSIPLIVSFLLIMGLRIVFEIPADLRANWIFQLTLDPDQQECAPLAKRVILVSILPWMVVLTFGIYLYLEGLSVAVLHTAVITSWSFLLASAVLVRFRKLPFTCSLPVFKQHSIVILIGLCFGFLIYVGSTAEFESSALTSPVRMIWLLPVAGIAWYIPRYLEKNTIDLERKMIFEETSTRSLELLRLSE
jgi:hypothetical protein